MKKYLPILIITIGIFFLPHFSLADTLTPGVQTQSGTITEWIVGYGDFRGYGTCAGITINGVTVSSDCASYYGTFDATGTWSFNVGDNVGFYCNGGGYGAGCTDSPTITFNPSSCAPVANGTVSAFPACTITCNTGFSLSGGACTSGVSAIALHWIKPTDVGNHLWYLSANSTSTVVAPIYYTFGYYSQSWFGNHSQGFIVGNIAPNGYCAEGYDYIANTPTSTQISNYSSITDGNTGNSVTTENIATTAPLYVVEVSVDGGPQECSTYPSDLTYVSSTYIGTLSDMKGWGSPELSGLQQYESDATTTLSEGGTTAASTVAFGATLDSPGTSTLQLQVEVEPSSVAFTGTSTVESSLVSSGAYVTVSSPVLPDGAYHWQARVMDAEGNASVWQTFNGTSMGTDFVVNSTPAITDQPSLGSVCPDISSSTRNLVFITHGWNDNATASSSWPQQMKGLIENGVLGSSWGVCAFDWSAAASLANGKLPWDAFLKANSIGIYVGKALARQNFNSIHFLAHSAGANLIQAAASWIKSNVAISSQPKIQLTFFDAYEPLGDASFYGKNPKGSTDVNWWAEQYVDMRNPLGTLTDTNLILSNAYNFNMTSLDPNYDQGTTENLLSYIERVHAWPYTWYGSSTVSSYNYTYGFPLSLEGGDSSYPLQYPAGGYCVLTMENTPCPTLSTTISYSDANLTGFSIENSTIDDSFTDATATITYPSPTSIKLFSGSPVWIKVTTTTTNPYNIINFHYAFESASGSQGMFSMSVDNQVVDTLDERIATSGDENDVFIGNLAPGVHTFAFRLDPYTDVQSVLELSNMQLGYLQETTSTYVPPIPAIITLGNLSQTYADTPLSAMATTTPAGLLVSMTYNGSSTPPTAVGSYAVVATVTSPGYTGTASGTLVIAPAPLTVTANNMSMYVGSSTPALTYAITGFLGTDTSSVVSGTALEATTAKSSSPAGAYPITIAQGTLSAANYSFNRFVNATATVLAAPMVNLIATSTLTGSSSTGYIATVTVSNIGIKSAANVRLTTSTLESITGSPLSLSLGTIAVGNSTTTTIHFPGTAGSDGATVIEKLTGTYTGGVFLSNIRVVLP